MGWRVERLERRSLFAVVINEFLASNTNGLLDEDNARSDWVELRNTGASSVDLSGWYLSDSASNRTKWQFPAVSIPANGYLLVFASSKNRAVAGQPLHTNFSLSASGEDLLLTMPDGTTVVDSFLAYPAQRADVSYGVGASTASTVTANLVDDNAPLRVISPSAQNAATDDFWREITFNDSSWISGNAGVGFDRANPPTTSAPHGLFNSYINTTLSASQMPFAQTSAYIRLPFTVADKDQLTSLSLNLRYDDGFIAFLNGHEVLRVNFDNTLKPSWNSRANGTRTNATVVTPVNFDLKKQLPRLQNGSNLLAIQAVNSVGNSDVGDLLIDPMLVAQRATGSMTGFMSAPTPAAANGVGTLGFVGDTHFSVDRGFFSAPFQTAITADDPAASIRYTLDGSEPTETNGTIYTAPLTISGTTTLRAIAYRTGYTANDPDTVTYIFPAKVVQQSAVGLPPFTGWSHFSGSPGDWEMDPDIINSPTYSGTIQNDLKSLPTMSVVMNWNDLFGASPQGIYSNTTASIRESVERASSVEYFSADGVDQFHLDAAIEVQGGSSAIRWRADKLSFQLKFKFPYGPTSANHAIYPASNVNRNVATEFDTLILDAQYNYTWFANDTAQAAAAKYVQDQVVSDLQNVTGGGAPHGRFVHLYLNGLYWGIYNLHERPDASFAETYYGGDKDEYDVIKHTPTGWVDGGITAVNNYAAMLTATRLNMSSASNYQAVESILDIDEFIDYMLVHYYSGNYDWGGDNYYASHNRVDPNGKWRFHAWDQEHAFSDVNFDLTTYTAAANNITGGPIEVHYNLLANPEYKLKFADHVQKLFYNGGALTPAAVSSIYQGRMTEIDRAIVAESARWGDNRATVPYTRDNWLTTQNSVLNNFITQRTNIVLNQFIARGWLSSLAAPTLNQYGGQIASGFQAILSKPAGSPVDAVIYYTIDGSDPRLSGGAINPNAVAYTVPITLNVSTQLNARILNGSTWSSLVSANFLTPTLFPARISEIHYHPADRAGVVDPEDMEFIELMNTSGSSINLQGVTISGGIDPYTFGSVNLGAGQRIVVARNRTIFQQVYGTGINLAPGNYTGKLDNAGEQLILTGPLNEPLQNFIYDDNSPWPTSPDGNGPSLELIDPLSDPTIASNWRASALSGGSPGAEGAPQVAPTVISGEFNFELGHHWIIQFSQDVLASLSPTDLQIAPAGGGTPTSASGVSWNASSRTATFYMTTPLVDGDYIARLPAGAVANGSAPLAANYDIPFHVLSGDANDDGIVDTQDFNRLAANFGESAKVFSQGNFNYDPEGLIDSEDFNLYISQYGKKLPAPSSSPLASPMAAPSLFSSPLSDREDDLQS